MPQRGKRVHGGVSRSGSAVRGQLLLGAEIFGLELISAPDVTECLRVLAAGLGSVRGREVTG